MPYRIAVDRFAVRLNSVILQNYDKSNKWSLVLTVSYRTIKIGQRCVSQGSVGLERMRALIFLPMAVAVACRVGVFLMADAVC